MANSKEVQEAIEKVNDEFKNMSCEEIENLCKQAAIDDPDLCEIMKNIIPFPE